MIQKNLDEIMTKSCPYCKEKIPAKAVKCMHCSKWVEKSETKLCPHCESEIHIKALKCRYCGKWVEEKDLEEESKENKPDKPEIMVKLCPYCESEIHIKALKCRYCGEWIEKKKDLKITEPAKNAIVGEAVREAARYLRELNIWR